MTASKKTVSDLCSEFLIPDDKQQITIDKIEEVEQLLLEDHVSRDAVGAMVYDFDILLEVFNPKFMKDIEMLTKMMKELERWQQEIEQTNIALGLPPQS